MTKVRQGEIWWANLPPPTGRRPILILTRSDAIGHLNSATAAPLTRTIRGIDSEVVLSPDAGVPTLCAISLDNIVTIPKSMLDRRIVTLSANIMAEVFDAIRFVFAMP